MKRRSQKRSLVALSLMLVVLCSPGCGCDVNWSQTISRGGVVRPDSDGDVLIIGGGVEGPSGEAGEASWEIATSISQIHTLSLTICTNGDRSWGKGIHSTTQNGGVEIYVNKTLVYTIETTAQGTYGDYWPKDAPAGSKSYDTGKIDVSGKNIEGPALVLRIVARPGTALDVHGLNLSATQ